MSTSGYSLLWCLPSNAFGEFLAVCRCLQFVAGSVQEGGEGLTCTLPSASYGPKDIYMACDSGVCA